MKKSLVVVATLALAFAFAGCNKEEQEGPAKAALTSVTILAEDNAEYLEEDIEVPVEPSMSVRVKGGGNDKVFIITLAAGEDDAIFVDNEPVLDGKATVDASYPVDIMVRDTVSGMSAAFELKFKNMAGVSIKLVSNWSEPNCEYGYGNDLGMAVAPDGGVYFSYIRKATRDVDGTATTDKYNSVSVAKWNGESMALVGDGGFTDNSVRSAAAPLSMTVKKDGTPVVMFKGAQIANFISVMEYKGGKWAFIGTDQGVSTKFTSSYGAPEYYFIPKTGNPGFFYTSSVGSSDANYRNYADVSFDGSAWQTNYSSLGGDYPKYGAMGTTSDGIFYRAVCCNTSDAAYAVTSSNLYGHYVYKMTDTAWEKVVDNFKPAGEEYGIPTNLAVKADGKGNVYVFAAGSQNPSMQVYKVDEEAKTLVTVGNALACTAGSFGSIKEDAAFAVSESGEIVCVLDGKLYVLNADKQWEYAMDVPIVGTVKSDYQMAYTSADSGVFAVIVENKDENEKAVRSISVFKFAPEE